MDPTSDEIVAVTDKALTITTIAFAGELAWQLTTTLPQPLADGTPTATPIANITRGLATSPIKNTCFGPANAPQPCDYVQTSTGSTIKLAMLAPPAYTKPTRLQGDGRRA